MSTKITAPIERHLEIKTYTMFGIAVRVKIDYDGQKISLLNQEGRPKQWVFAERELEYMAGWRNILTAMEYAIGEAEKDLRKHVDKKEREKMKLMRELDKTSF